MKKLNRWLIASLTIGLLGGVVGVSFLTKKPEAVKATGETNATTTVLVSSGLSTVAEVKAHVFVGTTAYKEWDYDEAMTAGASITWKGNTYIPYTYTYPNTYTSAIFRIGSNQTADLSVPDFHWKAPTGHLTAFVISSLPTGTGTITGEWDSYSVPTFTSSSLRIWGDPNQTSYMTGYIWSVHYWNEAGTIDKEVPCSGYTNVLPDSGSRWLGYFDVPSEIVGCHRQAKVYDSATGDFIVSTAPDDTAGTGYKTYTNGDNAQVYYFYMENMALRMSQGAITSTSGVITAACLSTVLGGYFTCSSDLNNGYGSFNTVISTWIHDGSATPVWWITGMMDTVYLDDFAAGDDAKYATGADRNVSTTVQAKYERMLALYTNSHSGGAFRFFNESGEKNNSVLIVCLSLAAASLAVGAYFLRKKRTSAVR